MIEIPSQIFLWIGLLISFALLIASFSMAGKARRFALSTFIHLNLLVIIPLIITDPLSFLPVSLPCLAIYYYFMYQIAEVVVPSFDRDDKKERWKQFWVFFWYSWGLQYLDSDRSCRSPNRNPYPWEVHQRVWNARHDLCRLASCNWGHRRP